MLTPRDVAFDWTSLPTHWVPGEPFVTHTINVLHLLLLAGERWFVDVFNQALPYIKDDKLREEVLGFIGQEAIHARSHQGVLDHCVHTPARAPHDPSQFERFEFSSRASIAPAR